LKVFGVVELKRLILAGLVVPGAIVVLILCYSGRATADADVAREHSRRFSSQAVVLTPTFTASHWIYLPFTSSVFPRPVRAPEGEYLLVEFWTHSVLGASCERLCIDFPIYSFDPQSGELIFYAPYSQDPELALGDDEAGYLGSGESRGGVGCGANSSVTKISSCPLSQDGVTLLQVDEAGTVNLERQGQVIVLAPGETWISEDQVETWDWMNPACVVTSTQRLTNYGFQDRDKIVYEP
jgi:hypothetical protein